MKAESPPSAPFRSVRPSSDRSRRKPAPMCTLCKAPAQPRDISRPNTNRSISQDFAPTCASRSSSATPSATMSRWKLCSAVRLAFSSVSVPEQLARHAVSLDSGRSEEHTSELQSHHDLVCRLLLEKKKKKYKKIKHVT